VKPTGFALTGSAQSGGTVNVQKPSELLPLRRLQATEITGKLVGVKDVPDRGLKAGKLGGKLRILLCRIGKVHELLPDEIVERALDAESPLDAASRPALLYPDLLELHADTIPAGLSIAQKPSAIFSAPSSRMRLAYRLGAAFIALTKTARAVPWAKNVARESPSGNLLILPLAAITERSAADKLSQAALQNWCEAGAPMDAHSSHFLVFRARTAG
jgi:hypothetical protein